MHTHTVKNSPEAGKTYTCILNEVPLYDATVERAEGCWATVKVVRPLPGKYEKQYKQGEQFEIKIAYYDFVEK